MSVSGLIQPPPGRLPMGLTRQNSQRVEPIDARLFTSAGVITADLAYLVHFQVAAPLSATAMEYYVQTAAGNVDLGIFSTTDFAAFTMLGHTGAVLAVGAAAIQSINLLAVVSLVPGIDYFGSLVGNNATLNISRIAGFGAATSASRAGYSKAALDPLATFSTPASGAYLPWLAIK